MTLDKLFCMLEERLVRHDDSRKVVQDQLQEAYAKMLEEADALEEKLSSEVRVSFDSFEENILSFIETLNNSCKEDKVEGRLDELIGKSKEELLLLFERKYEIKPVAFAKRFSEAYRLSTHIIPPAKRRRFNSEGCDARGKIEQVIGMLKECLDRTRDSMPDTQRSLADVCAKRRENAEKLENGISRRLQQVFAKEDARIQGVVCSVRRGIAARDPSKLIKMATAALLTEQTYSLRELPMGESFDGFDLDTAKKVHLEVINFGERKPVVGGPLFTNKKELAFTFTIFKEDELKLLKPLNLAMVATVALSRVDGNGEEEFLTQIPSEEYFLNDNMPIPISEALMAGTTYRLRARIECCGLSTQWSDEVVFTTPEFEECCRWKECPCCKDERAKYSVGDDDDNKGNYMIAAKDVSELMHCAITGNVALPINRVTSWSVKVLMSKCSDGNGIYIGVAPFDIEQKHADDKYHECGWYLNCHESTLCYGPEREYDHNEYGPRKEVGQYVRTGDSVGVVMDTARGELLFVLGGVDCGVAYEGISLDKPLVPCVILKKRGDSVELDVPEIKERTGNSLSAPFNITLKNVTWDAITLTWYEVCGASFYQVEVDGDRAWHVTASNTFTKRGLLPGMEHSFRVRTMRGSSVSEWSGVVKGRTMNAPEFSGCVWKECPGGVREGMKYCIDKTNPRIVTKVSDNDYGIIIGSAPIPFGDEVIWDVRLLKSKGNNAFDVSIGVAPFDTDQDAGENFSKYGWYLDCYDSTLHSGPLHNRGYKVYGLGCKGIRHYMRQRNSVGVVMDTRKGELSFILDGRNHGIAYEGIPLDKPLVPCVVLRTQGDSVEFSFGRIINE